MLDVKTATNYEQAVPDSMKKKKGGGWRGGLERMEEGIYNFLHTILKIFSSGASSSPWLEGHSNEI